jgi:hypothetical protein
VPTCISQGSVHNELPIISKPKHFIVFVISALLIEKATNTVAAYILCILRLSY